MNTQKKILGIINDNRGLTLSALAQLVQEDNYGHLKESVREMIDTGILAQSRSKLYPVLRQILVFDKSSEEVIQEINLENLTAAMLKNAFNNNSNDPLFFDVYDLNKENSHFFVKRFKLKFRFDKNHYQLTATINKAIAE